MEKFAKVKSIAADLQISNIDTDMIIPKQFLKTIKRTGLGKNLFFEMRYDDNGNEIKDFIIKRLDVFGEEINSGVVNNLTHFNNLKFKIYDKLGEELEKIQATKPQIIVDSGFAQRIGNRSWG